MCVCVCVYIYTYEGDSMYNSKNIFSYLLKVVLESKLAIRHITEVISLRKLVILY